MATTTYQKTSDNQFANRAFLNEGVRGVKCLAAGISKVVWEHLSEDHKATLSEWRMGVSDGEYIGTIEVYENGAMNAFRKSGGLVIGYWAYRP